MVCMKQPFNVLYPTGGIVLWRGRPPAPRPTTSCSLPPGSLPCPGNLELSNGRGPRLHERRLKRPLPGATFIYVNTSN